MKDRIEIRYNTTVSLIRQDSSIVHIELSDGTIIDVGLLVGADGIHPKVRGLIFGKSGQFMQYMGYSTTAFTFPRSSTYQQVHSFDSLAESKRQITL